jgi:DNA-binding XRE family transcriptional regulator
MSKCKNVIHAIQNQLTKRKTGLTVCNREFNTWSHVSSDPDLVTCKFCLRRSGQATAKNAHEVDPDILNLFIAKRLKDFRLSARYTQGALAEASGMPRLRITLLERGETRIGVADLLVFSIVFRKKVTDFLPDVRGKAARLCQKSELLVRSGKKLGREKDK